MDTQLLAFAAIATIMNMVFNVTLVQPLGLTGGCLVLILTKLVMTVLTFVYCQAKFRFFGIGDIFFPGILATSTYGLFLGVKPLLGSHIAVALSLLLYLAVLLIVGPRFMGRFPGRVAPGTKNS